MINLIKAEWFKFRKTKLLFNVIFLAYGIP